MADLLIYCGNQAIWHVRGVSRRFVIGGTLLKKNQKGGTLLKKNSKNIKKKDAYCLPRNDQNADIKNTRKHTNTQ